MRRHLRVQLAQTACTKSSCAHLSAREICFPRQNAPNPRVLAAELHPAILHLRCVVLNGLWAEFEAYLARRSSLRLVPKPAPTETHDAKKQFKKAA